MKLLASLRSFAAMLFHRSRIEGEMEEELRFHIEKRADDLELSGLARNQAVREARIEFGGYERVKEECRQQHGGFWLEKLWADVRYGLRMFRRNPGFTAVAVFTLALGIGANTAIFSVVDSVVLSPLPYHQPDRLVIVWAKNPMGRNISPSYPDFEDWQRSTRSFEEMAAFTWHAFDLTHPGSPEHLDGWQISSGFFKALGADLIFGRDFTPEENQPGGTRVAIISERVWRDRFGHSTDVLGKLVTMDGVDYTIVGVAPTGINLGGKIDVYTPVKQGDPLTVNDRRTHAFVAIARLKPGTTAAQAQADVAAIEKNLGALYPKFDQGLSAGIVPLKEALVGDVSGTLLMLLGSVGLVLLIACANVASLLLARAAARKREFAVRSALGAQRSRIVLQMITESVLLSSAGGCLGLVLAKFGVRPLLSAVPGDFPRAENAGLNLSVLLFTFAVSVAVGIAFGLVPALKTWNVDHQSSLKQGGRGSTRVHHRAQSTLVIIQTALTLVLLVGAGLLFRTIRHLWNVNPGFDPREVITFKAALAPDLTRSAPDMRVAYQQMIKRIQAIAGVQSADLTTLVPLSGMDNEIPFWVGPEEPESVAAAPRGVTYSVGPDYFRTMGIPILRGRPFSSADTVQSEKVVIIDSDLAKAYFPGKDPVGQTLTFSRTGAYRIVGVAGHVHHWGLGNTNTHNQMEVYTSFYQIPDEWLPVMHSLATVLVRTPLDAAALLPAIKAAVYGSGNAEPIYDVRTMHEEVSASMAAQNFPMVLLGAFAALALLLASVGTYGLLANVVQHRTQEIGIRMALGARRVDVFRMVMWQGLRMVFTGTAIGAIGAFILARVLSSFSGLLYGVGASDPITFLAVSTVLMSVALAACYIPARRAMGSTPMVALRHE
jgi:predicted permease